MGTKRRVTIKIKECFVNLNGYPATTNLNIILLGSYDVLICMVWLEKQGVDINCLEKTIQCVCQGGHIWLVREKSKPVSVQQITTLHLKKKC